MAVTTFQGTVKDGQVRLAADVTLPEAATVYVVVPAVDQHTNAQTVDGAEVVARMLLDDQASEEGFGEPAPGQPPRPDGQRMAAALERLAAIGAFTSIDDPVAWQRAERAERDRPNRAD
jgi:hypothetical protein